MSDAATELWRRVRRAKAEITEAYKLIPQVVPLMEHPIDDADVFSVHDGVERIRKRCEAAAVILDGIGGDVAAALQEFETRKKR